MFGDLKTFVSALSQISEEKGLAPEKIIEVVEAALSAAYKKDFGKKGEIVRAKLNLQTGDVKFWQVRQVIDESMIYSEEELSEMKDMRSDDSTSKPEEREFVEEDISGDKKIVFNPKKHILLAEAKSIDPNIKIGEEMIFPLEEKSDYGRIAAQTAKQVILQKLKEAERENIYKEYQSKEGEVISGVVQRIEGKNIYLDIGKTLGLMPSKEQIPREYYKPGQRLKVLVKKVEETPQGPVILLSRAYPKLVSKLFEIEVPEISSGQIEIKAIAREPGSRTKVAVASSQPEIDPIGAMVGQRGTRVAAVINNIGGEKIDIIRWSENLEELIASSLSPAKIEEIRLEDNSRALAIVPEDQLSLAIGKDGQNVRLAAKLTGWKIDVCSRTELEKGRKEKSEEVDKGDQESVEKETIEEENKDGTLDPKILAKDLPPEIKKSSKKKAPSKNKTKKSKN